MVPTKLEVIEEAIITTKGIKGLVADKEEDLMLGFVITLLNNRITSLESQILKKEAVIEYLSNQLISSNSLKSQSSASESHANRNGNFNKIDDINKKNPIEDSANDKSNKKYSYHSWDSWDSLLNGINEKGLPKNKKQKIENVPVGTSDTILGKVDEIISSKPNCLIVNTGTNDSTCGINTLNIVKRLAKTVMQKSSNKKAFLEVF